VLPRLLGALVLFITGMLVWGSSLTHLLYARHESWILLLALIPPVIGLWRLHRRSQDGLGYLEILGFAGTAVAAIWFGVQENLQLTPNVITLVGLYLCYGSLAFYHAYSPGARSARFLAGVDWRGIRVRPLAVAGLALGGVLVGLIVVDPVRFGPEIGTIAILLLFAIVVAFAAAATVRLAERTPPPRILAAFRVKRTPVFVLVVLWVAFAASAVPVGVRNVDVIEGTAYTVKGIGISDAWERWLDRNGLAAATDAPGTGPERPAVPFVLISSSGGGLRSAVWTALVLDCIFETTTTRVDGDAVSACADRITADDFTASNRLGATSGVSGGSLGFVAYTAYLSEKQVAPAIAAGDGWIEQRLGDDYLAASMGWGVFVDLPRELIGFGPGLADRGEIMEEAWERSWEYRAPDGSIASRLRQGLFSLWYEDEHIPLMVLNGTSSQDGCRFNTSVLDADVATGGADCKSLEPFTAGREPAGAWALPATRDIADFLCDGQDIYLSTAALLSSRFPFLSPSGKVVTGVADGQPCGPEGTAYVVDGGYLEGSGARTLFELWEAFEPLIAEYNAAAGTCIVPVMIHIDNGYESPVSRLGGPGPSELAVPLHAVSSAKSGIDANARASAALAFDLPFRVLGEDVEVSAGETTVLSRYARITTRAHPGVQAPLGWTLSDTAIADLRSQLSIEENLEELAEIRLWFSDDLVCRDG
jgi:hypothetical protein